MSARRLALLAGLGALGAAVFVFARREADAATLAPGEGGAGVTDGALAALAEAADAALGVVDDLQAGVTGYRLMQRWQEAAEKPENAELVAVMHAAEAKSGIPFNLVVRVAWQESRFRPDAYNVASGATGIMQIVPRWHPNVDPLDPVASIYYGADYLASLHRQFGTWELALKAYNWGPGNVRRWLDSGRTSQQPLETRHYSAQILADLAEVGQVIA